MHGTMHNEHCPSAPPSNSVPRVYIYIYVLPLSRGLFTRARRRAVTAFEKEGGFEEREREKKENGNTGNMRAQLSGRLTLRF